MSMSMEEKFRKASEERKREQKEAEQKEQSGGYSNFEPIHYTALEMNKFKLIRFLGEPIRFREKGTSPKLFYQSFILGDDENYFKCNLPLKSEDQNHLLFRIYNKIMDTYKDQDGKKQYKHEKSHPILFNRVAYNNSSHAWANGWKPELFVAWNVIDRDPDVYAWHKENKKTLLLSKKASKSKTEDKWYYKDGVPLSAYNAIYNNIADTFGPWEKYDILLRKKEEIVQGKKEYSYEAFHPVDDERRILSKFDNDWKQLTAEIAGWNSEVVERPLTEEELSWERYNFDNIFKPTSYIKIKNRLGGFIQKVDSTFQTSYYEELEVLAEQEKKEKEKENVEKNTTFSFVAKEKEMPQKEESSKVEEPTPEKGGGSVEEEKPKRRRTSEKSNEGGFSVTKLENEHPELKGLSKLTPEEKAQIVDAKYDDNGKVVDFNYNTDSEIFACIDEDNCPMSSPETFNYCPLCGSELV